MIELNEPMDKDKKVYLDVVEKQLNVTQNPIVSKITKHSKSLREIKFRGKRLIDGTWIYGGFMKTQRINKYQVGGTSRYNTIIPETLGQYVGLHDKHGREIYEGDIILREGYLRAVVRFGRIGVDGGIGLSGFAFQYADFDGELESMEKDYDTKEEFYWCPRGVESNELEVIGNVYDSPQLLKGEEV